MQWVLFGWFQVREGIYSYAAELFMKQRAMFDLTNMNWRRELILEYPPGTFSDRFAGQNPGLPWHGEFQRKHPEPRIPPRGRTALWNLAFWISELKHRLEILKWFTRNLGAKFFLFEPFVSKILIYTLWKFMNLHHNESLFTAITMKTVWIWLISWTRLVQSCGADWKEVCLLGDLQPQGHTKGVQELQD